jgi:hypothetical protein
MREKRTAYRLLVGRPEENRPLGIPICRCLDNSNMDVGEVEWDGLDWNGLVQDRDK